MKYLKTFEGRGRIEIKGNHVYTGPVTMPNFVSEKPDYTDLDGEIPTQKTDGVDIKWFIVPNNYNYIVDPDDHIDQKEIDKLIEPHVKKFSQFGFDPSKDDYKSTPWDGGSYSD